MRLNKLNLWELVEALYLHIRGVPLSKNRLRWGRPAHPRTPSHKPRFSRCEKRAMKKSLLREERRFDFEQWGLRCR